MLLQNTLQTSRLALAACFLAAGMGWNSQFAWADDQPTNEKRPETLFEELDKNQDGRLTSEEFSVEQRKFFDHLVRVGDADKNGTLTKDEFLKGLQADDQPLAPITDLGGRGGGAGKNFDPKRAFERMDQNKDGKLTLGEVPEPLRPRLERLFGALGKTELTEAEYMKAVGQFRKNAGGGLPDSGGKGDAEGASQRFTKLDGNQDGKLTAEEVPVRDRAKFAALLKRAGQPEDGSLTREQFVKEFDRPDQRPGKGRLDADEMFKRFDTNQDGKLTRSEAPERLRSMLDKMLAQTGKGADGGLTREEVNRFLGLMQRGDGPAGAPGGAGGKPDREFPSKLFSNQDADGDGKISKTEARGRIKENFERLDRNSDGMIDADEFENALRALGDGLKKKKDA